MDPILWSCGGMHLKVLYTKARRGPRRWWRWPSPAAAGRSQSSPPAPPVAPPPPRRPGRRRPRGHLIHGPTPPRPQTGKPRPQATWWYPPISSYMDDFPMEKYWKLPLIWDFPASHVWLPRDSCTLQAPQVRPPPYLASPALCATCVFSAGATKQLKP